MKLMMFSKHLGSLSVADAGLEIKNLGLGADVVSKGDIFCTATGNVDVITIEHMRKMKDRAIVCDCS